MTKQKEASDAEILWFSEFYESYSVLMFRKALFYSRNPHDAEDIVSDCCLTLIRQSEKMKAMEKNELIRYISVSIRHAAFRYMKYWNMLKSDILTQQTRIDGEKLEDIIIRNQNLESIGNAIKQLPENERFVLQLKTLEGLSDQQIAERLDLAVSSIRKYIQRARYHLCKLIKEEEINAQ